MHKDTYEASQRGDTFTLQRIGEKVITLKSEVYFKVFKILYSSFQINEGGGELRSKVLENKLRKEVVINGGYIFKTKNFQIYCTSSIIELFLLNEFIYTVRFEGM